MSKKDYLPNAYNVLMTWLINFMSYLSKNLERFGIAMGAYGSLQEEVDTYEAANTKADLPNAGPADKLVRKEAAETVRKVMRAFVNTYLRYNIAVTDDDRIKLGLTVPDPHRTKVPVPDTVPVVTIIDTSKILRITLHFRDSAHDKSHAKPFGVHAVEIRSCISKERPASMDDMLRSNISTRSSFTFEFEEGQRGLIIWFRLRWENTRGEKGPWSEFYFAIIP
jgi:hypothetical protein